MHELAEIYNYYSCLTYETNPRIKSIWQRFTDYELGHLHFVLELFQKFEKRDPAELLPQSLPEPIEYRSHREYVRKVLREEVDLRARGTEFIGKDDEGPDSASELYRAQMNSNGSPSEIVAASYRWRAGTELAQETPDLQKLQKKGA
jgi:hypothetical protein